jgi:hypothetical protein
LSDDEDLVFLKAFEAYVEVLVVLQDDMHFLLFGFSIMFGIDGVL